MAIVVERLSKRFRLAHERSLNLKSALLTLVRGRAGYEELWALREVSLRVARGETVAVVGSNGSGKSTLLSLIAGILRPTAGRIETSGRVFALFELGAGFHPELSGRDNVYLNGSLLGLSRREITAKLPAIAEFAELEAFIDSPVKSYSTGMYMRLGFAIAAQIDPDVLLIDEALAVGDEHFQAKCYRTIAEFQQRGKTIVVVSHDDDAIRRIAGRVIWLERGEIRADGPVEVALQRYLDYAAALPGNAADQNPPLGN